MVDVEEITFGELAIGVFLERGQHELSDWLSRDRPSSNETSELRNDWAAITYLGAAARVPPEEEYRDAQPLDQEAQASQPLFSAKKLITYNQ